MKIPKKVSSGVPFVRKTSYEWEGKGYEADIKKGDTVKILNEGIITPGQYGDQYVFKIQTRNGEKAIALNQTTLNILHDELGDDSKKWIGQDVHVIIKKDVVAGRKVEIAYLVTEGWSLDEYGDLQKEGVSQIVEDDDGLDTIKFED